MKMIRFTVTQKHIDNGIPLTGKMCPIALALNDKFPQAYISVISQSILVNDILYKTSQKLMEFIWKVDQGRVVQPSTFQITRY